MEWISTSVEYKSFELKPPTQPGTHNQLDASFGGLDSCASSTTAAAPSPTLTSSTLIPCEHAQKLPTREQQAGTTGRTG